MEKKYKKRDRFENFVRFSKLLSPICAGLFYVCCFIALLLGLVALIVVFVNVPTEDMLLPPFMHTVTGDDGTIEGYRIMVGNGIRMYADYADVELGDIKTVIYAGILVAVSVLLICAPVFRFMSLLLGNVSKRRPLAPENPKYISFIGTVVMLGNTFVMFVSRFYNYFLVKTFVSDGSNMSLQLGFDASGMVFGLLILFFGLLYAYASKQYAELSPPTKEMSGNNMTEIDAQGNKSEKDIVRKNG